MQAITKEHENFKDDSIQSNNGLFYVIFEISGIFAERRQDNGWKYVVLRTLKGVTC